MDYRESGPVKLTLYDLTGKVIRVYELNGQKGMNQMKVQRSEISGSGVIYYQFDAAQNSATRRMIINN
ncbi:MAG: T9SS type A sorting domain-containing protein [Saprospiraceae bacterium]|nr:T9SS type A sorting domain-containing protein [Saprospiraceae bacterium]